MSEPGRGERLIRKYGACLAIGARNFYRPSFWRNVIGGAAFGAQQWQEAQHPPQVPFDRIDSFLGGERYAGGLDVTLPIVQRQYGNAPYYDLVPLCALIRHRAPRRIFEFGTFTGATTLQMIANCPPDAHVWTLDLPPDARQHASDLSRWDRMVNDAVVGTAFEGSEYEQSITQLFSDSRSFDPAPFTRMMEFIWVDACHEYEFVVNDTQKALQMLAPGGMVAWHDYPVSDGVRRCLDELVKTRSLTWLAGTSIVVYAEPLSYGKAEPRPARDPAILANRAER